MNSPSNPMRRWAPTLVLLALLAGSAALCRADELFAPVAAGDPTYRHLRKLEAIGLLEASDVKAPLTRFEVANDILKADRKYRELVVALAGDDIPAPPEDSATPLKANPGDSVAGAPAPSDQGEEAPVAEEVETPLAEAAAELHSLKEAYSSELDQVTKRLVALKAKTDDIEARQFDLRKVLKAVKSTAGIAIHGLGRTWAYSQKRTGDVPLGLEPPETRDALGFLELRPEMVVGTQLKWDATFRITTRLRAQDAASLTLRRLTMDFNPAWLSAQIGNFEESYTPLTLWNRDTSDLAFKPDAYRRWDDQNKYESYVNDEPDWLFRGLRVGTALDWPNSKVLDGAKFSVFAHMIRNGFNSDTGTSGYLGFHQYSSWILGGRGTLSSKEWWIGMRNLQLTLDGFGESLLQPLGTDTPGSTYDPQDPATWARRYLLGSVRPDLKLGLGGEWAVGARAEYAYSSFHDDVRDPLKTTEDYALIGGPYLKLAESTLQLNSLDVGPYYFAPLAQTRQSGVTTELPSPIPSMYQGPNPLDILSRAGGNFDFYNRTYDNTFPYGLATPNRKGFGADLDWTALEGQSFHLKGSAYAVKQITPDLVVNATQDAYVPVDDPTGNLGVPTRKFLYLNVGPSVDFGPLVGADRKIILGANGRMERTQSSLGTLDSRGALASLRIGVLPKWDLEGVCRYDDSKGRESGYNGQPIARYSYLFDDSDLGQYSVLDLRDLSRRWSISSAYHLGPQSDLFLDFEWVTTETALNGVSSGRLHRQTLALNYEARF